MLISVKASHAGTGSKSELQLCSVKFGKLFLPDLIIKLHFCDSWGFLGVKCLECFLFDFLCNLVHKQQHFEYNTSHHLQSVKVRGVETLLRIGAGDGREWWARRRKWCASYGNVRMVRLWIMWKVAGRNDVMASVNCNSLYLLVYTYSPKNALINTSMFSSVQTSLCNLSR